MQRGSQKILVWHTVGKGQGQQSSYSSGLYCLRIVDMVTESVFHDEKCIQSRSLAEKWPFDWNTEILDILKSRLSPSHRIESIFGNNDAKLQWFPIRFHPSQLTQLCVNTLVERQLSLPDAHATRWSRLLIYLQKIHDYNNDQDRTYTQYTTKIIIIEDHEYLDKLTERCQHGFFTSIQ